MLPLPYFVSVHQHGGIVMKKYFLLFLMVFLIANKVWSKPILEIASFQDDKQSGGPFSAINPNSLITKPVNLKKYLIINYPHYTNIETRFYVDEKGFVVVGESESLPAGIGKNDLFISGNLFVDGYIYNPRPEFSGQNSSSNDELKAEISTLKDEVTILKNEIANLKAEIKALRK